MSKEETRQVGERIISLSIYLDHTDLGICEQKLCYTFSPFPSVPGTELSTHEALNK